MLSNGGAIDWRARLVSRLAERERRKAAERELRAELKRRRDAGKRILQEARIRRHRRGVRGA